VLSRGMQAEDSNLPPLPNVVHKQAHHMDTTHLGTDYSPSTASRLIGNDQSLLLFSTLFSRVCVPTDQPYLTHAQREREDQERDDEVKKRGEQNIWSCRQKRVTIHPVIRFVDEKQPLHTDSTLGKIP